MGNRTRRTRHVETAEMQKKGKQRRMSNGGKKETLTGKKMEKGTKKMLASPWP